MKTIDNRLSTHEIGVIKKLIGKKLSSYSHEEFVYTNTVSDVVKFLVSNKPLFLYCFLESNDYFGSNEDISKLSFESTEYPFLKTKVLIDTKINMKIKKIIIVNDNNQIFENGIQTYDMWYTRAIIFEFEGFQVSFEKTSWMSEEIKILRGKSLIDNLTPLSNFCNKENWAKNIEATAKRDIIYL